MLRHRPWCDPRFRSTFTCPCGVTDRYVDREQARADDFALREEYEREAAR